MVRMVGADPVDGLFCGDDDGGGGDYEWKDNSVHKLPLAEADSLAKVIESESAILFVQWTLALKGSCLDAAPFGPLAPMPCLTNPSSPVLDCRRQRSKRQSRFNRFHKGEMSRRHRDIVLY
jgi:hypothetical protein